MPSLTLQDVNSHVHLSIKNPNNAYLAIQPA